GCYRRSRWLRACRAAATPHYQGWSAPGLPPTIRTWHTCHSTAPWTGPKINRKYEPVAVVPRVELALWSRHACRTRSDFPWHTSHSHPAAIRHFRPPRRVHGGDLRERQSTARRRGPQNPMALPPGHRPARPRHRHAVGRSARRDRRRAVGARGMSGLMNMDQLAARLGVTRTWVKNAVAGRRIPHTRIGRHVRFTDDHFAAIV